LKKKKEREKGGETERISFIFSPKCDHHHLRHFMVNST